MTKTKLCKKFVHKVYKNGLWKDQYDSVIWLLSRRLKKITSRSIVELLQNEFPCTELGEPIPVTLNKIVHDKRTLFLLNGLNEVSSALEQDSTGECVPHDHVSRCHVIITSPPHITRVLDDKPPGLELEVIGCFPQRVKEYLQQVSKEINITDKKIKEIQSSIQQRLLVRSLTGISIQLDASCYTWNAKSFPRDNTNMPAVYLMITQGL